MIPSHPERASKKSPKSDVAGVVHSPDSIDAPKSTVKSTLIRRVTSKFNSITIPAKSGNQGLRARATLPGDTSPPSQGSPTHRAIFPTLPNGFISKEHREAALRERGLLPSHKDLSAQEREADQRLGSVPSPVNLTFDGATEAERFKANWLASNRASESNDLECGPPAPPSLKGTRLPPSPISPDGDALSRSGERQADLPPAAVASIPPLSPSLYLDVLHEEPPEQ